MATQDQNSPEAKQAKVRLAKEHVSGIIVPRWWRAHYAIFLGIIAAVSIGLSLVMLDKASKRVAEQQAPAAETMGTAETAEQSTKWHRTEEPSPDLPLDALAKRFPPPEEMPQAPEQKAPAITSAATNETPNSDGGEKNGNLSHAYEEPLSGDVYEDAPVIRDATGPRVTIPEEYIPEPETTTEHVDASPEPQESEKSALQQPEPATDDETAGSISTASIGESDINLKPFEQELLEQQQTWLTNAITFNPEQTGLPSDAPMIAIVIDDMGVDRRRSPQVIALPGPMTLSFLTYARDLEAQTQAALEAGHELMIHIPMEPGSNTVDPGPNVLRVEDTIEQTLERLRWGLDKFDGYVGLNNHMGSKFTQHRDGVRAVLEEVRDRGLLFLDSRTAAGSVASEIAREIGVPFATRNVFLDHVDEEEEIRKSLAQTERLARKNGAAVAIGHPHDKTIKILAEWLPTVTEKGFMLVPMSELVRRTWLNDS